MCGLNADQIKYGKIPYFQAAIQAVTEVNRVAD